MENITKWKARGNEFFGLKDYLKAINCYEEALQHAKDRECTLQSLAQKKQDDSPLDQDVENAQKLLSEIITIKA